MTKKLSNKKGFTLAELLIVVAIIGILVAISVPIFTQQLKKARVSTNEANARNALAAANNAYLAETKDSSGAIAKEFDYSVATGSATAGGSAINAVNYEDTKVDKFHVTITEGSSGAGTADVTPKNNGTSGEYNKVAIGG